VPCQDERAFGSPQVGYDGKKRDPLKVCGGPGVHHTLGSDHHPSVNVKGIAQSSAQKAIVASLKRMLPEAQFPSGSGGILKNFAENGFKIHEGSNLPDPGY